MQLPPAALGGLAGENRESARGKSFEKALVQETPEGIAVHQSISKRLRLCRCGIRPRSPFGSAFAGTRRRASRAWWQRSKRARTRSGWTLPRQSCLARPEARPKTFFGVSSPPRLFEEPRNGEYGAGLDAPFNTTRGADASTRARTARSRRLPGPFAP